MAKIQSPSRMLLTPTKVDNAVRPGTLRFELWRRPEVSLLGASKYVVSDKDQMRLDLVAANTLGDSRLWWAIADANKITNPLATLTVGLVLFIPTIEAITVALAQQELET